MKNNQAVGTLCAIGSIIDWDQIPNLQAITEAAKNGDLVEPLSNWLSSFGWEPSHYEFELSRPPVQFDAQGRFDFEGKGGDGEFIIVDHLFRQHFLIPGYKYNLPQQKTFGRSVLKRDNLWESYLKIVESLGSESDTPCNIYQFFELLVSARCILGTKHRIGFRKNETSLAFLRDPIHSLLYAVTVKWKRVGSDSHNWAWHISCILSDNGPASGTGVAGTRIFYNYPVPV